LKPRIFIGSSGASEKYAGAIHDALADVAECSVWTENAFSLSKTTIDNLMKNLRDSDFGVFVFAPDDTATIKGEILKVTRDNVVYEAGLFGGYLGPERCFIVLPRSVTLHLPTDLLGITYGLYEDNRTDKDPVRAVSSFCRQVKERIRELRLFSGHPHERLRELCTKFDCCSWIPNDPDTTHPTKTRVDRKIQVASEIDAFCASNPVNKYRLLQQHRAGYYVALLSAIRRHPESEDVSLILEIKPAELQAGFQYYRLMDAVEALKTAQCCSATQLSTLSDWLKRLPNPDAAILERIGKV
jgi:hypothetical protein